MKFFNVLQSYLISGLVQLQRIIFHKTIHFTLKIEYFLSLLFQCILVLHFISQGEWVKLLGGH